ncbi:hypothetical protein F4808DRAFT_467669 [Astrocystis sublimbata]|nr:hypothetical protein F4808DRAFT_467669 [Astrocystis sublimbata]
MGDLISQPGLFARELSIANANVEFTQPGCTDLSFYPGWNVQNFTRDDDHVEFYLRSFVAQIPTVFCSDENGSAESSNTDSNCDRPMKAADELASTSFTLDSQTNELTIDQTWSCSDKTREPIVFNAVGSLIVQTDAEGQLLPASLTAPVQITPPRPLPPVGYDRSDCRARSESKPPIELSDLAYLVINDGYDAWFGVHHTEEFQFNWSNQVIDLSEPCKISKPGAPGGPTLVDFGWQNCTETPERVRLEEFGDHSDGRFEIYTSWNFNNDTQILGFNQTWYCDDPEEPTQYTAHGVVSLSATECVRSGSVYYNTVTCRFKDTEMSAYELDKISLPPDTLHLPEPSVHSCTVLSFVDTRMEISEFQLPSKDPMSPIRQSGNSNSTLTFHAYNPTFTGFDLTALSGEYSLVLDEQGPAGDGAWIDCGLLRGRQYVDCQMSFDRSTSLMRLNETWICEDKDPAHPIRFNASFTAKVPVRDCDCSDGSCPKDIPGAICLRADNFDMTLVDLTWSQ